MDIPEAEITLEYHEHPFFNGQYHQAVWAQTWVSGDTHTTTPPPDAPVSCAVCGKTRGDQW